MLILVGVLGAGFWFKGVLADRDKLASQMAITVQELANLSGEIERMNKVQALDYALRENIEAQKVQLAADLAENQKKLKYAKGLLDEATRSCLDRPLPQSYLDRLPVPPAAGDQGPGAPAP